MPPVDVGAMRKVYEDRKAAAKAAPAVQPKEIVGRRAQEGRNNPVRSFSDLNRGKMPMIRAAPRQENYIQPAPGGGGGGMMQPRPMTGEPIATREYGVAPQPAPMRAMPVTPPTEMISLPGAPAPDVSIQPMPFGGFDPNALRRVAARRRQPMIGGDTILPWG